MKNKDNMGFGDFLRMMFGVELKGRPMSRPTKWAILLITIFLIGLFVFWVIRQIEAR
jgi:hypothetical protein